MLRSITLIEHKNTLDLVFPAARAKNVCLVIGSSLNARFISGSPRCNYGKSPARLHLRFLKNPGDLAKLQVTTESTSGLRRFNFQQRLILQQLWLQAPAARSRLLRITPPCKPRSLPSFGRN